MVHNLSITVSSTIDSQLYLQKARILSEKLGLPFVEKMEDSGSQLLLLYTAEGLMLAAKTTKSQRLKTLLHPDFIKGKVGYRLANDQTTKQPLARAAGIKAGVRPSVLDGTAGLGVDGFVLAALGCTVTMCERSPLLYALLADALTRAAETAELSAIVARITLVEVSTQKFLSTSPKQFETIYLDPMYPHSTKSALNQEAMRTIRTIVGDDADTSDLFRFAREYATKRVVVKRPKRAPLISDTMPSHVIEMKNSRFDVYLQPQT